jgi:hypothetical protein
VGVSKNMTVTQNITYQILKKFGRFQNLAAKPWLLRLLINGHKEGKRSYDSGASSKLRLYEHIVLF